MNKEDLKNLKIKLNEKTISIEKFLSRYYGINFNVKGNHNIKLKHEDVVSIAPFVKQVSFDEFVLEELCKGNLIAVKDSYGFLNLYRKPELVLVDTNTVVSIDNTKKYEEIPENIENLSVSNLALLCKKLKRNKQYGDFRYTYKVLKLKKGKTKKGRYENDEY